MKKEKGQKERAERETERDSIGRERTGLSDHVITSHQLSVSFSGCG